MRRMLASKNRAAYSALFREALGIGLKPLDAVLGAFETRKLKRDVATDHPLVLIVGAPRSGTTLVYQALSAWLDVTYPSNLTALFPKAPLTTARLQRWIPTRRQPNFENFYGQTTRMRGPNDAFHLWNRWFGNDRYQLGNTLADATVDDMQRFFANWTATFDKPFLNKNNRNTECIQRLAEHLPQAKFVLVRRNPVFVVNSLIRARDEVQGSKQVGWGLKSGGISEQDDPLAYVDDVCRQVMEIDRDIDLQLQTVASNRVMEITYEGFCEAPQSSIKKIVAAWDGLDLNPGRTLEKLPAFQTSQKLTLTADEHARVLQCLDGSRDILVSESTVPH